MLPLALAGWALTLLAAVAAPNTHAQTRPCDTPTADCHTSTEEKNIAFPAARAAAPLPESGAPVANPEAAEPEPLPAAGDAVLLPLPAPVPAAINTQAVNLADGESYGDAYRILSKENSCSRFFGGPALAVEVLNGFARQLRRKNLGDEEVAIRMSGDYSNFHNVSTGGSYRLFEKASINTSGPFVRRNEKGGTPRVVGRFPAHSRQARALVLLHELGHLILGRGGAWLLPNDGHDLALSERNTLAVERQCVNQLVALSE
jgi:hypothetical protein